MARSQRSRPDRRRAAAIDWAGYLKAAGRAAPVVVVGALLFTAGLRSSIAEVLQFQRPALALAWDPHHARTSSTLAQRAIAVGQVEAGERLAKSAIDRDPVDVSAYSALALAADGRGDQARAARLMELAHTVSRRDWKTELWLISQAIRDEDYGAAVRHFDIAMRTSDRGVEDLMPLLVAATEDRHMIQALVPVLDREPEWKSSFLMSLAIGSPSAANVVELSRGRLDPRKADERAVLARLIERLVGEGQNDLAWSVYRVARPGTPDRMANTLRDTRYGAGDGFPPLDWQLADEPQLSALREARRDGQDGFALALIAEGGQTGEVARQVLRLPPGSHTLQFVAGTIPAEPADRPQLRLACAGASTPFFETRPPATGEEPRRVRANFSVPAGCRWQTFSIAVGSNETPEEFPWIADIRIDRPSATGPGR
jgi:hypothetical protein